MSCGFGCVVEAKYNIFTKKTHETKWTTSIFEGARQTRSEALYFQGKMYAFLVPLSKNLPEDD